MENNACSITFINPDIRLRPYVRYYYILNTHEDIEVLTFPLCCPQIIFHKNLRCSFRNYQSFKTDSQSAVRLISRPTSLLAAGLR